MATLRFDLRNYPRYLELAGPRLVQAGKRAILSAALRAVALMQRRTDLAPPANPAGIGSGGAVNTGHFRRAWKATPAPDGAYLFNDAPYAGVVEFGRRAGSRMPPRDVIAHWAQRRLGMSRQDAMAAAWVIGRAIARRGLVPRRILNGSLDELRKLVANEIELEIEKELAT